MNNRKKFLFLIFYLSLNILIFSETVTVRIFSKYVISKAEVITKTESGSIKRTLIELIDDNIIVMENGKLILKNKEVHIKSGLVLAAGQSREYPGDLIALIFPGEKGIVLIASMDIEDYTTCVLASELDNEIFTPELAKAMAVVIRTFSYFNRRRHAYSDFCDLTHCQSLKGLPLNLKKWKDAVVSTKGEILNGQCDFNIVFYSVCCGGITEDAGEFANGKPGKCGKSIVDGINGKDLCNWHRYYRWEKVIKKSDFEKVFSNFIRCKNLRIHNISITKRTASGRVKEIKFEYVCDNSYLTKVVNANKFLSLFGKIMGWANIPSKLFDLKQIDNFYVLKGSGHGHGVGLCVAGAKTLSDLGYGYKKILKFYFSDLLISKY